MAGVRRTVTRDGKTHSKWRFWYYDWQGKRQWGTGTEKRADTLNMARKLEEDHRQVRLGYRPPPKPSQKPRAFSEIVEEYLGWGNMQGGRNGRPWGEKHAASRRRHLAWAPTELNLELVSDLIGSLAKVEKALRKLRMDGRHGKTIANYAESVGAFCNWCVLRGYLDDDPLKNLKGFDTAPASRRRALTPEEIWRLFNVAPPKRRLLYQVACATGLRANELDSLTVGHFDPLRGGLHLDAEWTKNRKAGFQPLPSALVPILVESCEGKCTSEKLLDVPSHTARSLEIDMESAGIPKWTEEGKIDFHAFRTTFTTLVVESGANVKEAQSLLRHSTPEMTMNIYARARSERLYEITNRVDGLVASGEVRATSVQQGSSPERILPINPNSSKCLYLPEPANGRSFDSRRLHH